MDFQLTEEALRGLVGAVYHGPYLPILTCHYCKGPVEHYSTCGLCGRFNTCKRSQIRECRVSGVEAHINHQWDALWRQIRPRRGVMEENEDLILQVHVAWLVHRFLILRMGIEEEAPEGQ